MSKKFLSPIKLAQGTSVPSAGSSGELFYNTTDKKVYAHNGTSWLPSGGGVTNSDTAPTSPANGDAWFNTAEGSLFIYYADGTSGQWVEATNNINNAEPNQIPAGAIMAWSSSVIPNNWLLCDGTAVSRTTYASLFAAIGTQYGVGDGSTTFNLPNLKGNTIVGLDSSQTEFNTLGETGGAKTHTLTVSEMPSHTHIQNSHNHTQDAHNHTQNPHTHLSVINLGLVNVRSAGSNTYNSDGAADKSGGIANATATNNATTATNQATTATNQNTGGGGAHNNLQPYIVLNYIIKYSAGETPGDSELATRVGTVETSVRPVNLGGTGASTFTSGAYLKGNGTAAVTSQVGIPKSDFPIPVASTSRYTADGIIGTAYGTFVTVTVTTLNRPVMVSMSATYSNANSGANRTVDLRVQMDGTTLNEELTALYSPLNSGGSSPITAADTFIVTPSAGSHTFTLQAKASAASAVGMRRASLTVVEL